MKHKQGMPISVCALKVRLPSLTLVTALALYQVIDTVVRHGHGCPRTSWMAPRRMQGWGVCTFRLAGHDGHQLPRISFAIAVAHHSG